MIIYIGVKFKNMQVNLLHSSLHTSTLSVCVEAQFFFQASFILYQKKKKPDLCYYRGGGGGNPA